MILERISLVNFKNIAQAELTFSPKINCLIGTNGEGKTNLLDAIYFLSFCKSAFCSADSQLLRHETDLMLVEGSYRNEADQMCISCGMKRGQKKHFRRNKKEYRRLSEHIGLIPLVFVSPTDTMLVSGASEERRRFMDVIISQYDKRYINNLAYYNKALTQRNAQLKLENPDSSLLDVLELQMGNYGALVSEARTKLVEQIAPLFNDYYRYLSQGNETVNLAYVSHSQRGNLAQVISRDRMKDLAVGYSLHGVHRDELEMTLDGFSIKREGSQGQIKTYVLALKLAQFSLLRQMNQNIAPLLLLDDVFDRLDANRVEQLVKLVGGNEFGQIFITDTNREHLDRILNETNADFRLFSLKQGQIELKEESHV